MIGVRSWMTGEPSEVTKGSVRAQDSYPAIPALIATLVFVSGDVVAYLSPGRGRAQRG